MKKIIAVCAAVLVIFSLTLPSVQAFAVSTLAIFRVGQAKTISVTFADLEQMIEGLDQSVPALAALGQGSLSASALMPFGMSEPVRLESIDDFTAFDVRLPRALSGETPELYTARPEALSFTLGVAAINETLAAIPGANMLDSAVDGQSVTVTSPPVLMAEYEDVLFFATMSVYVDAERQTKQALYDCLLSLPFVSDNLRSQLQKIDVDSRDIYLPEIAGLGRTVLLNGTDGYIYSMYDLQYMATQFAGAPANEAARSSVDNMTAVVWTKGGVLYCVMGAMNEIELCQIAASA